MVKIKCVNSACTSPDKKFVWDELQHGTGIAQPNEADAKRVIAECPACQTSNVVWVKGIKRPNSITRK